MKRSIGVLAILATLTGGANAMCVGSGGFQVCNDTSGNSYTVNRFGNNTYMQGHNAQTGSSWSQNSQTYGNTTYHQGLSNGQSWNMQQNSFGNVQTFNGRDTRGNSFSRTCVNGFCN